MFAMFWGCIAEMIGYGGRIMLWEDPFSFTGFLMQISECSPRLVFSAEDRRDK